MPLIHPTAIVDTRANIAPDVRIGAYCVIGGDVRIGAGSVLHSHVVIEGHTTLGERNEVFPFTVLGHRPQDLKYKGEPSELKIGNGNVIREHVTMNPGTQSGGMLTQIGDNGLYMVGVHIAHDCRIGSHVIFANQATLAGHVTVEDYALIGGLSAVHQFVRIGAHAVIGGMSGVEHDVIPFGSVMGERAHLAGLNLVGLKRRGFSREATHALRAAYRALFESPEGTLAQRAQDVAAQYANVPEVGTVIAFMQAASARSLCIPKMNGSSEAA